MKRIRVIQSWGLAASMLLLRATCRVRLHDDPRDRLRDSGSPYAYSILHAHQVSAAVKREKGTAAMVSMSGDGQLLLPGFWTLGIKPIRGSNRSAHQDKGGRSALKELIAHVVGGLPALIAVDGPRGPRKPCSQRDCRAVARIGSGRAECCRRALASLDPGTNVGPSTDPPTFLPNRRLLCRTALARSERVGRAIPDPDSIIVESVGTAMRSRRVNPVGIDSRQRLTAGTAIAVATSPIRRRS